MALFDSFRGGMFRNGPGVNGPPPSEGWPRWRFLFKTDFGKLVTLSLMTVLFSLPLVTAPAALCGMERVISQLWREGNTFLWQDFFEGFKGGLRRIPAGLLLLALPFLGVLCWALDFPFKWLTAAVGAVALVVVYITLPLLAESEEPLTVCVTAGFRGLAQSPKNLLGLLAPLYLSLLLTWLCPPLLLPTLAFFSLACRTILTKKR